jgi:hypothetical protein
MGRAIHLLVWRSSYTNDIQQHVNSANSGDVDIRNLTVTLIRTVGIQRSWYQMPGYSLVVFGVTFAVVARRPASGHGVAVLSVGDW